MLQQRGMRTDLQSASHVIQAVYTTSDFPELLGDVAIRALLSGYDEADSATHRVWTRESTVSDFKTQYRIAMSEAGELELVPEASEFKFQTGTLGRTASFKLQTFGRIFGISRQALVNDDLGGFTRLPQAFGASASRKEAEITYGMLTSNPIMSNGSALFSAEHGNLQDGAALSVASLGAARTAMRLQRGLKGQAVLNVVPRFLIVPAALETVAEQLLASLNDPAKQNDTINPAWIRALTLVVDGRLDEASSAGWYLAASPTINDTVEIAHLEGEKVHTEERNDFDTDQYQFKARLDFAACVLDWRGLVFNPGG
jgi:hypothetical protein